MDLVSNLFSLLKQGSVLRKSVVVIEFSGIVFKILVILHKEGFISSFKRVENKFKVYLKYYNGYPLIQNFKIYSTFSKKYYCTVEDLLMSYKKIDFLLVSTSLGILTKEESIAKNIGGEVLVKIN